MGQVMSDGSGKESLFCANAVHIHQACSSKVALQERDFLIQCRSINTRIATVFAVFLLSLTINSREPTCDDRGVPVGSMPIMNHSEYDSTEYHAPQTTHPMQKTCSNSFYQTLHSCKTSKNENNTHLPNDRVFGIPAMRRTSWSY